MEQPLYNPARHLQTTGNFEILPSRVRVQAGVEAESNGTGVKVCVFKPIFKVENFSCTIRNILRYVAEECITVDRICNSKKYAIISTKLQIHR